jgi:Cof subfamily protein (haloacid dehalogenase superfamily)
MDKKIVFFDIDGTIFDYENGITQDTKRAIEQLIENGHYVCLCTGRRRVRIYDEVFLGFGIQGVIGAGGAYIEWDGKVLLNHIVPEEVVDGAVDILRETGFAPVMEGPGNLYYDLDEYTSEINFHQWKLDEKDEKKRKPISGNQGKIQINKINGKNLAGYNLEEVIVRLSPWFHVIVHEDIMIEAVPKGYTKGTAVQFVTDMLEVDYKNTYGFGDSVTDIDLLRSVGHGVAMGDAQDELKEVAEMVTKNRLDGGIRHALNHYQLI